MKKLHILLSLALVFVFATARSQSPEDGDAVFKKVSKEFSLAEDGSMSSRITKEVKLLTYNSFHRLYGETFIVYNPEYQKLKINSCYTVMKDGKKVVTPANAFNEVLPGFAANAPVFNKLREMVVTHTGLEIGATIFLDYEIVTAKGYFPAFMGQEALYENSPVDEYSIMLKVPQNSILKYRLYNSEAKEVTGVEGPLKVVSWKFRNVPAYVAEGSQPRLASFLPTLAFSNAADARTAASYLTSLPAFKFECNEQMRAAAMKIREVNKNDLMAVLKMQEMVINEVSLYPLYPVYSGFRCRTPVDVWASGGGTELEKAVLLTALLKAANINAVPLALISGYYEEGMGVLPGIDLFMVKVFVPKSKDIFLSLQSVDDQSRVMKLGERQIIVLEPGEAGTMIKESWQENGIELNARLTFDTAMNAKGFIDLEISGACNPYFDLLKSEKKAASLLKGPFGEAKETKITKLGASESHFSFEIAKEMPARRQGNYFFLDFPYCDKGILSWHLSELTEFRKNPFEIQFPVNEEYSMEFTLADGMKLVTSEVNEKTENTAGKFEYSVKQQGRVVKVTKSVSLSSSKPEKGNYEDLRFILNKWQSEGYRKVVFKI